jgi:hypothetical protein
MTISWSAPESNGGWPIQNYLIWVDNGNGIWPSTSISVPIGNFGAQEIPTYEILGLTDGKTYGVKL